MGSISLKPGGISIEAQHGKGVKGVVPCGELGASGRATEAAAGPRSRTDCLVAGSRHGDGPRKSNGPVGGTVGRRRLRGRVVERIASSPEAAIATGRESRTACWGNRGPEAAAGPRSRTDCLVAGSRHGDGPRKSNGPVGGTVGRRRLRGRVVERIASSREAAMATGREKSNGPVGGTVGRRRLRGRVVERIVSSREAALATGRESRTGLLGEPWAGGGCGAA